MENAAFSERFSSFLPWAFHSDSYGQGKDEEKYFLPWKTMWKMLQKHVFSRDTAYFDSLQRAKLENITYFKSIFSVDFIR